MPDTSASHNNNTPMQRLIADVVVVGGGGSGLAAAIEAASLGRSVILVERNTVVGGSTAKSIGSMTATSTPHQLRDMIHDSADDHYGDMESFNARSPRIKRSRYEIQDNAALRRLFVESTPETFRWLSSMGIEFFGPILEIPHRKPRMHNVLPNSGAYIYHLERAARRLKVQILTSMRATKLLVNGSNQVSGVICESPSGRVDIGARGGVVLATGDFSGHPQMRAEHVSPSFADVEPVNSLNAGDGHQMVLELGGRIVHTGLHSAGIRFQPPPPKWVSRLPPHRIFMRPVNWAMKTLPPWLLRPIIMSFLTTILVPSGKMFQAGAVLVNARGERFVDERTNPSDSTEAVLAKQPSKLGYIILDAKLAKMFSDWPNYVSTAPGIAYAYIPDYRRTRRDIFLEAATLGSLGERLGMPPGTLEKTLQDHNASLHASDDDSRALLDTGPFIAMGPVRHFLNFTDSGVAVNTRLQVLGSQDVPIEGLFAAGFVGMGGLLLEGHGHHLSWAFGSGRLAGRNAAYRAVSPDARADPSGVRR